MTGTGARKQPLVVVISTMSSNPNDVMTELVTYGEQINSGIQVDPSFIAFIYTVPMEADIWEEANWYLANPALGDFRDLDELRKFAEQAKRIPAKEAVLRNLYLNQPVERSTAHRIIPRADWDACALSRDDLEKLPLLLKGRPCYGGLDLSDKNDLTAFALVFPFEDQLITLSRFWTREHELDERSGQDHASYREWVKSGHLYATPGKVIEYDFVAQQIAALTEPYDLQAIACDPNKLERFEKDAADAGVTDLSLYKHPQTFDAMDGAVRELEDSALKWTLRHDANPVMTWCNDNVRVILNASGARRFDKQQSKGRIDGIVALAMALNLAALSKPQSPPEVRMLFV